MATPFPPITSNDKVEEQFGKTLRFTDETGDKSMATDMSNPFIC
jgi:hypothetical protein